MSALLPLPTSTYINVRRYIEIYIPKRKTALIYRFG